ncbi:MAG TPA: protein translocase subunit SecD [Elusimicrobia bacterium]|nr:MAG: protein-export membrane protein SecD [Elusimicrobia bacterium RIFOXYA12_FULL_49_49]OGS09414.1 MAG: protein-export membrane protein SecD [Elusimicrobia bacterium RIFOXYA1_FULL_47_7]OGS09653.1 MAG: protein-export membrane protein SecD [Elusimicrobia bacterium RIFOXYB1_FULL_48_9]OGS15540.1 MAG: protein-export membrane protein SecD [Elusimicrobia bacterium RIFOXYA2_FULL_47_53]OGS26904.1 MAG: protein-export membrane protein SecD [Elusimicrobia bacterium RIFOXYB12_FULL_50_12]OGS30639.1 MAG: 
MGKIQFKLILSVLVLGISLYYLYPSFEWYRMPQSEREQREKMKDKIVNKVLNLGLDLRGGTHLLLELDATRLEPGIDVGEAVDRAREIIRNRIDQFGVTEPLIARQGDRWIVVQLPGVKDPQRAKDLVGKTALLEFRLVETGSAVSDVMDKLRDKGATLDELGKYPEIAKLVPKGFEIFKGKEESYYLLKSSPELTGAYLVNAKVELGGQYGFPHVSIEFNKDGAKLFARVTEENVEKNLAIVLDGVVQSAPVIRTRIPDGKAIIEGNFSMDEAKLLATVLRAGALPAPVKIIEERTVGPTLGDDSIKFGVMSTVIGLAIVLIFMIIYYGLSGVIADFALLLNFVLLLGVMASLHSTLTLPGIAGIALTLGMAVDANVLILERIREELKAGKTTRLALDAGYDKAFVTILDSNLTTLIAALFLFQFGTGPIKGFAVTLTIGIIISMFTAIMVTRMIYDLLFREQIIDTIKL